MQTATGASGGPKGGWRGRAADMISAGVQKRNLAVRQSVDFTVILEPQPEGGFTVSAPPLPEVVTEGDSEAEALRMAEDAILAILASIRNSTRR